jgi:nucleotide-binding universal stress UspA family protein
MSQATTSHPLLVALSLVANHDEHLLWFARDLSRRLRIPIKLVHACEETEAESAPFSWFNKLVPRAIWPRIPGRSPSSSISQAEKTLCEIARRLSLKGCGCATTFQEAAPQSATRDAEVRTEKPAGRALVTAAVESKASIILLGAKEPALWFNWSATNVREVMHESPCPVLVLRRDLAIDPSRERMGIVVADDLDADSKPVLETAFKLAHRCEGASLIHVHVAPPGSTVDHLEAASRALSSRSAPYRDLLTHHLGTYKGLVLHGAAVEAVLNVIHETGADILVTGAESLAPRKGDVDRSPRKASRHPPSKWLAAPCALLVVPKSSKGLFF